MHKFCHHRIVRFKCESFDYDFINFAIWNALYIYGVASTHYFDLSCQGYTVVTVRS